MSTLHDLRSTLEQHADGVEDTARYVRPVAVRARIRVVRRRRVAAVAVAAALVLVAGISTVTSLRQPSAIEPAGPTVLGLDVPDTWSVNEFSYDLDQTATFRGAGDKITLTGDEDAPARAVAFFATDLGSGSATLFSDDQAIARATGDEDAERPVPISNADATLTVQLDGVPDRARTGIATYTASDELAEGVGNGTAVFRQVVAGAELLAGGFSDEDGSEATLDFTGTVSESRFATYCVAAEKDLWLNLAVDGMGLVSRRCQRADSRDPGSSWDSFPEDTGPSGIHTVRAFLTRGRSDTPVTSPGTVLGAGVYHPLVGTQQAAGTTVDGTVEHAGRAWRLDRVIDGDEARIKAGKTDLLLGFVAQGDLVFAGWTGELVRGLSTGVSTSTPATLIAGVLLRGDTYDVELGSDEGELVQGALLVYRPMS